MKNRKKQLDSLTQEDLEKTLLYTIDSIFCFTEIIRSYDLYGDNYIASFPSARGLTHEKMAYWCKLLLFLEEYFGDKNPNLLNTYMNDLQILLGYNDLYFLAPSYHKEKAVEFYDRAIRTHTDSRPFVQFLENMYYLDDDFNDDILHFNIALERYRINTGLLHGKLFDLVDNKLSNNYLYRVKTYTD